MRRLLALAAILFAVPAFAVPTTVSDLAVSAPSKAPQLHAVVTFTAPSDGGGDVTSYSIRYATTAITNDATFNAAMNASNRTVSGTLTPATHGTPESIEIVGLKPNQAYYFAMKSTGGSGTSAISNFPAAFTTAKYVGYAYQVPGGGSDHIGGSDVEGSICRVDRLTSAVAGSAGVGSLRYCIGSTVDPGSFARVGGCANDPRTVIFTVGGTIPLAADISIRETECKLTVDGSTSPNPGITIGKDILPTYATTCSTSPTCPAPIVTTAQNCPATCTQITACPADCASKLCVDTAVNYKCADTFTRPGGVCMTMGEFKIGEDARPSATQNVILDYLRFDGNYKTGWDACEAGGSSTLGLQYWYSDFVGDHLTIRNGGDGASDIYSGDYAVSNIAFTNTLMAWSFHPQLLGSTSGVCACSGWKRENITLYRNVYARCSQRVPLVRGNSLNVEFRNNIVFDWASSWISATNTGDGMALWSLDAASESPGKPTINIINNWFLSGGRFPQLGLFYGTNSGNDAGSGDVQSDGGGNGHYQGSVALDPVPNCDFPQTGKRAQGEWFTGTNMGDMRVAGNILPQANCDQWSTRADERPVTAGAEVTTIDAIDLQASVLPDVGTHYRLSDETALLAEIVPPPAGITTISGVKVKGVKIK